MNINKANIANALHSVAKEHIIATADEIYDNSREQYQTEVNEGVGKYDDNPEFVEVKTDSEGNVLYGVLKNGNFYFGAGVPKQIKDVINSSNASTEAKIAQLNELLSDEIQRATQAEQNLADTKVDKEEGKSLIPTQYIQEVEDDPEFVKAVLDSEGKILYGVKANGDFMFGYGVPSLIQEKFKEVYNTLGNIKENPEFVRLYLDDESNILWGIQRDGNVVYGAGVPKQIIEYIDGRIAELSLDEYEDIVAFVGELIFGDKTLQELLDSKLDVDYIPNPEFVRVVTDSDSKVLQGIKFDGTTYIGGSQEVAGDATIGGNVNLPSGAIQSLDNPDYIDVKVDSENKILEGITSNGIKKINIPVDNGTAIIDTIDSPEFIEAKVDAEGKLIEGINKKGEKIFGVIPPLVKKYIDENMPIGGSGVQSIEYDEETGDMYATYDTEGGITDVSMEPNGDIYVEYGE